MRSENVKHYLSTKHIEASDAWISACIEWLQTEYPEQRLHVGGDSWLKEKVLEQWLQSDLTEIASCCLPFNLNRQRVTTISGHFALQVNQVRDIGNPAYGQLQRIRKDDINNTLVSADQPHQAAWEPKPSRMLLLQLTDGTSLVQGMEYSTIPALNVNIKPGCKIMVSGKVKVRRGVLMLTKDHITIIGGEVDTFAISNAAENILCRALRLEETQQPRLYEAPPPASQSGPSQASQYYPSQLQTNNRNSSIARSTIAPPRTNGNLGTTPQTTTMSRTTVVPRRSQNKPQNANISRQITPSVNQQSNDDFPDNADFDDMDFLDEETEAALLEAEGNNDFDDADFLDEETEAALMEVENRSRMETSRQNNLNSKSSLSTFPTSVSTNSNPYSRIHNNDVLLDDDDIFIEDNIPSNSLSYNNKKPIQQSNLSNHFIKKNDKNNISTHINNRASTSFSNNGQSSKLPIKIVTPFVNTQNSSRTSSVVKSITPIISTKVTPMSSSGVNTSVTTKVKTMPPFTYLCCIPKPSVKTEYIIKGFVLTLTSRLEHSGNAWRLKAKINDGTASCEINIHDQVLRKLIGLSVEEMYIKKTEAQGNKMMLSQLTKKLAGCQKKLISLCGLLHLEYEPNSCNPTLIKVSEVTSSHAEMLHNRSICST